jgi:DNA-binding CsgD family transcriptional regulator
VNSGIVLPGSDSEPISAGRSAADQVETALVTAQQLVEEALASHRERQARGRALFESHASEESLRPFLARFLHQAGHRPVLVQASSGMWLQGGRAVPLLRHFQQGLLAADGELRLLADAECAADPDVADRLADIVRDGAEVRISGTELPGVLVLDRMAVILRTPDADRPGAWSLALVRMPEMVAVMNEMVKSLWGGAVMLDLFRQRAELQEGLTGRILLLLRMGYKDEAAARTLGLSVRTYRRHVAVLMERLNANSRFQAGARAALLGL